ncbi:hypothetical protein QO002_001798 [Pararhizobium capsulatum DSM 1112]|uniref:Porin n=1 Tax=Pararhizobium capsulatum DSM 1112 TaxID=1121113 RepID=A0ABU0BN32_9HYPH|nr:hypothetical protein [Pararhizobium capsulatum DSM 1112]
MRTLATVNYNKVEADDIDNDDSITGFVRLQRDF